MGVSTSACSNTSFQLTEGVFCAVSGFSTRYGRLGFGLAGFGTTIPGGRGPRQLQFRPPKGSPGLEPPLGQGRRVPPIVPSPKPPNNPAPEQALPPALND